MSKLINNSVLWWFAGEDPHILSQCSSKIGFRFGLIGLLVLLISISSTLSIAYGIDQILESAVADVLVGAYCGLFILILYLFLLHTLSRNVLPEAKDSKTGKRISFLIRILFLIALGYLVAQPINSLIFKSYLTREITHYKDVELKNYERHFNFQNMDELALFQKEQDSNNYFIQKVIILNTLFYVDRSDQRPVNYFMVSLSLLISMGIISLFIAPVFLKRFISISNNYYKVKRRIQTKVIDQHHAAFVNEYNAILSGFSADTNYRYKTAYLDPPYNTRLKPKPKERNKDEFLKWLLDEGN
ncbi:DUF4407 domain-containing protein [Leeuwenhoekiella marinoflava]|uniref:DUF4407 domain-containing protein n=2 Tax=Leeuwenhoekiella marinoflava TaxID=988 RepID=A0A4Q0PLH1_9FLAO|nr:DUF4407 domain-containing protein [Leeuwenhoekiella marinoflava]RXG29872.1 putative protein DUF4407 [Leeuwenhoekiella marinoflava]SHF27691.1 protein of unknown function [Leeuwenhoekiella marinoflava DSM 3653]